MTFSYFICVVQDFYIQQGEWLHIFANPLPAQVSVEDLLKRTREFGVEDVRKWVDRTGGVQGRFRFFETYARNSEFYQLVAKPLLSIRTVGSMDVERRVKPIKHNILTKTRNRTLDPKGVALYGASENLKHIMKAKKILGKKITDSLS